VNKICILKGLRRQIFNLIACEKIERPLKVKAKIRYNQKEQDAIVEQISVSQFHVEFDADNARRYKRAGCSFI
jgi:tRNA U34 2-thiouridine synthase MnmA/TrmU